MKNYVGRKAIGFNFASGTIGIGWHSKMNNFVGQVGKITEQYEDCVVIDFGTAEWMYPISLIDMFLIEDGIKVVDDGFVWKIVTDYAEDIYKSGIFELYVLYDDGSESLIDSHEVIQKAIDNGLDIGIEVGFLP